MPNILFGSSVRGERLKESDIDLIVVSQEFEKMEFHKRIFLLQKHWKHQEMLEAFGFTPKEFNKLRRTSIVVREANKYGTEVTA